jgi:hypothetical protein
VLDAGSISSRIMPSRFQAGTVDDRTAVADDSASDDLRVAGFSASDTFMRRFRRMRAMQAQRRNDRGILVHATWRGWGCDLVLLDHAVSFAHFRWPPQAILAAFRAKDRSVPP